jgi:hypothetical protein
MGIASSTLKRAGVCWPRRAGMGQQKVEAKRIIDNFYPYFLNSRTVSEHGSGSSQTVDQYPALTRAGS